MANWIIQTYEVVFNMIIIKLALFVKWHHCPRVAFFTILKLSVAHQFGVPPKYNKLIALTLQTSIFNAIFYITEVTHLEFMDNINVHLRNNKKCTFYSSIKVISIGDIGLHLNKI